MNLSPTSNSISQAIPRKHSRPFITQQDPSKPAFARCVVGQKELGERGTAAPSGTESHIITFSIFCGFPDKDAKHAKAQSFIALFFQQLNKNGTLQIRELQVGVLVLWNQRSENLGFRDSIVPMIYRDILRAATAMSKPTE